MFTVGYITYISDLKLEDQFPWLEKYYPERYQALKIGLTEGVAVPGFPAGFKVYEKEALIGIVHVKSYERVALQCGRHSLIFCCDER